MRSRLRRWLPLSLGTCFCSVAATISTILFDGNPAKAYIPLLFLVVIALVAIWFGNGAGIVGTVIAGAVFATFLYQPILSPLITDTTARDHVIWMVLLGIVISDLLGAYSTTGLSKWRF